MHGYTGMMNFETIGGLIIEAHLRFADQWCDLYGEGWVEALVELYAAGAGRSENLTRRSAAIRSRCSPRMDNSSGTPMPRPRRRSAPCRR